MLISFRFPVPFAAPVLAIIGTFCLLGLVAAGFVTALVPSIQPPPGFAWVISALALVIAPWFVFWRWRRMRITLSDAGLSYRGFGRSTTLAWPQIGRIVLAPDVRTTLPKQWGGRTSIRSAEGGSPRHPIHRVAVLSPTGEVLLSFGSDVWQPNEVLEAVSLMGRPTETIQPGMPAQRFNEQHPQRSQRARTPAFWVKVFVGAWLIALVGVGVGHLIELAFG